MHIRIGAMALVFIIPINRIDRSTRVIFHVKPLRPRIVHRQKILFMARGIARTFGGQNVDIKFSPIDIIHENIVSEFFGPSISAQINHGSRMRMAATRRGRPKIARMGPTIAYIMCMVRDGFNVVIRIGIEMFPALPLITSALNDMEHVRNHTNGNKWMSILIKINAPRIA